ncbi:MAG: hypothetical protein IKN42_05110 [Elusimicrobia bacterium]|nr:hypothetical protein [Elusimicrobiota bacterium]
MKKLLLIIIALFLSIYICAETSVSVSSDTVQTKISNNQTQQKDENNLETQVKLSTNTVNVSSNSNTKEEESSQVNKSTNTVNVSTNTVLQVINSTSTVNVSTNTQNIDITMPLKYKEVKEDKNIEVSSTTVIPDENDLGTYYSSGAIVEKPQKDSNYDLNLPTTTALGIAGENVLDKLNLNKSTTTATDINKSTAPVKTSSSTVTKSQEPKKEKENVPFTKKITNKLPFDSKLQLSGRKLIGVNYSGTIYDNEESGKRANSSDFSMEQELQMKIKGSVGDRLELNVDFDDTQEDKKDIYILYKGKGNEFVREAAFGDINVDLPSTEFSGYSKELFGAKVDTQYKGLKTKAFFSKTKGYSESKQFKGNSKMEKKVIADTSYIKYKYYSIVKDTTKTIKNDTAKVYLDKIKTTVSDYIVITKDTDLYYLKEDPKTTKYNGNFIKLTAGTDFTIDYNTGILTFKNTLSSEYVVAIDYQYTDGTWLSDETGGNPQIIKDINNTDLFSTEVHTFYSLGNYQITKYNGRDNFILEVRDLNDTVPSVIDNTGGTPSTKPVPKFPNIDGYDANIIVDYDNGVFNLQPITGKPLHDDLYTSNTHKYNFVAQYEYKIKIFNLRTGIVPMSEKVVANGKTLKINEDYMLDYDVGILTILKDEFLTNDTVIDVSYDYSPLGGTSAGSTLVGIRSQYDFTDNISLGGSFIYEFAAEDTKLPDIYSTPSSTLVGEVDAKVKDIKITDNLKVSASAEYATSKYIQNTTGKAIIESMESAKQEDSFSLIDDNWFYAATPNDISAEYDVNAVTWRNYDIEKKEISPSLEIISGEKQQVMDINYNLISCDYASIGQKVSAAGYDFSKKLYLEIWIKVNFAQVKVRLDLASAISEDSDQNYILDTEDKNGDGIISPWEDIGRDFTNKTAAYGISKIGANNGKLDTEDLNGNNILDRYESDISSFILGDGNYGEDITNTSWQRIQIPLDITTDADKEKWKNIRIARLTVNGSGYEGKLTIGKISVVGNKWTKEQSDSSSSSEIYSIGRDNPQYVSLLTNSYYRSLYDIDSDSKRDEQALAIDYNSNTSGDEFFAKATYSSGFDMSNYEKFKFFLYIKETTAITPNESFFIMRVGGDEKNYYQYCIPMTDDMKGKWNVIEINQPGYGANARWDENDPKITKVGEPSLQKIAFIETGVQTNGEDKGQIWINEIHVTDAKSKDGNAWKADLNINWGGKGAIGAINVDLHRKSIDKDFETFAPGTYDRDFLEDSANLTFKGVDVAGTQVLPINASLIKTKTVTPLALQNTSDQVSVLDEGKVVSYTGKVNTVLSAGTDLPKITLEYNRLIKDTENIERLEDKETVSANMVYLNPIDFEFLPTSLVGDYKISNSAYKVYPTEKIEDTNAFLDLGTMKEYMDVKDFLTLEKSETWGLKAPFSFYDKVIFSPAYVLTKVNEKNKQYFENEEIFYDKSLNQDIGASLNFKVAKWFQPNIIYSLNTIETYDLSYSSSTLNKVYPGQKKAIDRVGTTEFTWNLQVKDIVNSKYLKSLTFTTSYRMQDSDSYNNVDKDFSSVGIATDKLWIRDNPLKEIQPVYSTSSYTVKTILKRDDRRVIGRYNPFEAFDLKGKLLPIKTMIISFSFTDGAESSYNTGTTKDSYTKIWPDVLIGMSRFEKLFGSSWMSDTQFDLKYNKKTTAVAGVSYGDSIMFGGDYKLKVVKKYDLFFSADVTSTKEYDTEQDILKQEGQITNWAMQIATTVKQWRFSLRYDNSQNWTKNSKGKLATQVFSNAVNGQATADLLFPTGIKLPLLGKIPLKNRLLFESNVFYNTQSSAVDVEAANYQNFGLKLSADYEISKNFRFALGTNFSRFLYTYVSEQNYTNIELTSKLTIQF